MNENEEKISKKELNRLKELEKKFYEIKHSTTYKWAKLLEENFIRGTIGQKIKFIFNVIGIGLRYFIWSPIKRKLHSRVRVDKSDSEKTFPELCGLCILDEFSYYLFKDECKLIQVVPDWKPLFEKNKVDFFFMESIWSGYKGLWTGIRNKSNNKNHPVFKILEYCKSKNIPTIFWNKEDPVYFDSYIGFAKHFDYIYTTDEDLIDDYKKECGHFNVYTLPFAINPKLHNPINKKPLPEKDIIFAGTYYRDHEDRSRDYDVILNPSLAYNFDIYSREKQNNSNIQKQFPKEYQANIVGTLDYLELANKYKDYKVSLNVNSVKLSKTMFSRRVLESIACGTPVISSYSKAIERLLGGDIVLLSESKAQTKKHIDSLIDNDIHRDRLMMKGIRKVLKEHTSTKRFITILDNIGIKKKNNLPLITILASTNKPIYIERILENIRRQKYENLESIIILNTLKEDISIVEDKIKEGENIRTLQLPDELTLGQCLNRAIEISNGDLLAKLDDDDFYSPYFLIDQYNGMMYSNADFVSKAKYMCYIEKLDVTALLSLSNFNDENQYTDRTVAGSTFVWKRKISEKIKFGNKYRGSDTAFLNEVFKHNYKVYSTNRYGYLKWKSSDFDNHTWKISDNDIMEASIFLYKGFDLSKVFI